ncbi:MAG: glycerophosphoryl diester phosphodiesterase [Actinomycetota bacterium]
MAFVTIFGHRGSPREAPENTLASFAAALLAGADGVELDVRWGPSRELLIHHDPLPDPVPVEMPTLSEVLAAVSGRINVEIKNLPTEPGWDADEAIAVAVAEAVRSQRDRIVVSAFTLASIDAVRAAAPEVPTGWLTLAGFDQLAAVETAAERGHAALHPHHTAVTRDLVDAAHAAGLQLNTWTVDDPDRMRELAAIGVDAIITNVPALAVATLR